MKALNVNKLTKSGVTFKFWVADWFALMNNKLGGDLTKIQTCGRYMTEVWRAVGMDMTRVQFLSSSEEINARAGEYWPLVLDIARRNNLQRIVRCSQIMGRAETDDLAGALQASPSLSAAQQNPSTLQRFNYLPRGPRKGPCIAHTEAVPLLQQDTHSAPAHRSASYQKHTHTPVGRMFRSRGLRTPCPHTHLHSVPDLLPVHAVRGHLLPWR